VFTRIDRIELARRRLVLVTPLHCTAILIANGPIVLPSGSLPMCVLGA